ncbi:acyl-coa n-acyltransferase [Lucifera butyrica]|uniref:Acyl-coa n-acyltransferase n=1 Tax=Lucifera butyrica TaxID=1351585 RepID=A0A498R5M4_9FIRM|nr:GNAT family N-acetyltransferase [Lucifera butyrica]VBB05542.1 acyl-coa n-acyltransferase [Lucifera butyrica]
MHENFIATPWDATVFGINTFEITALSERALREACLTTGHFTIKVDPLSCKKLLHNYGFYYCDTLIEPHCSQDQLVKLSHDHIFITREVNRQELMKIAHGAFSHGRFHRDFNIDRELADLRYDNWLNSLYESGNVWGLFLNDELAGFFGCCKNKIVLHALKSEVRGKGLAKYFWSMACQQLFLDGHDEISSSISAANMAILNLYSSLGFHFRNPLDVYHKISYGVLNEELGAEK